MKTCKLCGASFDRKEKGRLRISRKEGKGESIVWICSNCAGKINIG
jgi:RNase P subunit RPR2